MIGVMMMIALSWIHHYQEEAKSKREKARVARAHAFEVCRRGNLSEFRPLLEKQDDAEAGAVKLKLSDRQDEMGKSGATFLHM